MAMKQNDLVLRHLKDFGEITPITALADYGIMRLGARIWELKQKGYDIKSELVECRNRYGDKTRYARYRLRV